jgi:polyisoprenyl-phosphate glycosyltransferase
MTIHTPSGTFRTAVGMRRGMPEADVAILTPVFNDWDSLSILIEELDTALSGERGPISLVVVDDGSDRPAPSFEAPRKVISDITVIRLVTNQGHQGAIAVGLCHIFKQMRCNHVVVMDSDGEDRPQDIPELLRAAREAPDSVVVASRAQRSEGMLFRAFYVLYRLVFALLVGRKISFGNFTVLPFGLLHRLAYRAELWSHFAASIVRLRFPLVECATRRGTRYRGKSSMNVATLVVHGLSAINVFAESAIARILIACLLMLGGAVSGILVVLALRFGTALAIPGWATTAVGILSLFLVQVAAIGLFAIFTALSFKKITPSLPCEQFERLISDVTVTAR